MLYLIPFICLLVVPIVGYLTFLWLNSEINSLFAEYGVTAKEFCNSYTDSQIQSMCAEIYPIFWLGDASLYSGIASLLFLGLIIVSSSFASSNRKRLVVIFTILVPSSLLFVSASTIIQGIIITYSLYLIQVNLMEAWYPVVTVGLGIGALIVALSVIISAFSINKQVTMNQMAVNANETDYPELWDFIRKIANKISAPVPNNIVIGLEPTFYATSANVRALSNNNLLTGETLYVSLPLMRLFTTEEFGAVVGHELGHFKAQDVKYTMKFAPLYRALHLAVTKASGESNVMAIPALSVLGLILTRFSTGERENSRKREFEADRIGARATSNKALSAALLKITAFSDMWIGLTDEVIESLEYGRAVKNMSKLYASKVSFDRDTNAAKEILNNNLDYKVSHPTDTHPTLSERLSNLEVNIEDIKTLKLNISEENAVSLINKAEDLEISLSLIQQKIYQVIGAVVFEHAKPENSEKVYSIARLIQTAAAVMVCADGHVEPSEIAVAEEKGKKLINHFNSLEFRELCLSPENLPKTKDLSKLINDLFKEDEIKKLTDFLKDIATSDGNISSEESAFIKTFVK